MDDFFANPAIGKHMGSSNYAGKEGSGQEDHETTGNDQHPPHIFHHSHSGGVTTHIFHHDGRHEMHEHSHGDAEGMAAHVHEHHGGGEAHEQDEGSGSQNG